MIKKIVIVLLLIAIAGAGYFLLTDRVHKATEEAALKEREPLEHKNKQLESKVVSLEKEVQKLGEELQTQEQEPAADKEKQIEAYGEDAGDFYGKEPGNVPGKIRKFFNYLDQKGYLKARGIEGKAYEYFRGFADRLMKSSPVVSGETQDAYVLLKNISYFFRVLGKEDILLVKDILTHEAAIMEPTMKLLFLWMDPAAAIEDKDRIILPLEMQYEYAAFFLQTIAGKAYLFRRDSKTRNLLTYYCVLVLDKANENTLNTYGVDIRPHVDGLIKEFQSYKLLGDKKTYLNSLMIIQKKTEGIKLERPVMEEVGGKQ
ncbi:MAG: hypothetical protein WCQ99_07010 [Pseudomonadota bacterium]